MSCPKFVHPDYWALLGGQAPVPGPSEADIASIRKKSDGFLKAASDATPFPAGMKTTKYTTTSTDGYQLSITHFEPLSTQQQEGGDGDAAAQRAILFAFGGGLVTGSVDTNFNTIAQLAETWSTQLFAPDYRWAPEHPFPAALNDVYSTLTWLQSCGRAKFNIDPARVVLFGMSAGANLAAATALKARDLRLDPPIAAQALRYPMLDDQASMAADDPRFPYLSWSVDNNKMSWDAYLGRQNGDGGENKSVSPYAAPDRAVDLHNLPPAQIGTGDLDLFFEEAKRYGAKLKEHNVDVEVNVYPGVPHGFDGIPALTLREKMWEDETRFIKKF